MTELTEIYNKIKNIISKVDLSKVWPSFHQYRFALYNNEFVCLDEKILPKTDIFMANTSIKYEGEYIAIWNVSNLNIDIEVLSSKLIHEMFHAFQMENNETRFPNEMEALFNYQYDVYNLSLKQKENNIICELSNGFNPSKFSELLKLRKYRYNKYNYQFKYESYVEQIEGTANYVELMALKQINYLKFSKTLTKMKEMVADYHNLIPVRIISYTIGALFICILRENAISFVYDFINEPISIKILDNILYEDICFEKNEMIQSMIVEFHQETEEYINENAISEKCILEGEYDLLGVNVYDARYHNNYVISNYFLAYKDNNGKKIVLNGCFVVLLNDGKINKIYQVN